MLQYSANKCVFSRRLKPSLPRSGSLKLSGREFQSDGPTTEKARGPSVILSRALGRNLNKGGDMSCGRRHPHSGERDYNTIIFPPGADSSGGDIFLCHRHRGITKKRRVADRRCYRAETSDTGMQRSVRYHGAWPCPLRSRFYTELRGTMQTAVPTL